MSILAYSIGYLISNGFRPIRSAHYLLSSYQYDIGEVFYSQSYGDKNINITRSLLGSLLESDTSGC